MLRLRNDMSETTSTVKPNRAAHAPTSAQIYGSLWWSKNVLNRKGTTTSAATDPIAIANDIRSAATKLKGEFMNEDGTAVDYRAMKGSTAFAEYCTKTTALRSIDLSALTDTNERKAFFLNIYNCLVIHAIVERCHVSLFGEKAGRLFFYSTSSYDIGGHQYSLNDIEHGILRANAISPVPNSVPQFKVPEDPRLDYIMPSLDPRIHFALNCGAKGCPPIAVYKAGSLDAQLNTAARGFLRNSVRIVKAAEAAAGVPTYTITLSQIMQWYGHDFGTTPLERLRFLLSFLADQSEMKKLLQEVLDSSDAAAASAAAGDAEAPCFKIEYEPYNWALNDK